MSRPLKDLRELTLNTPGGKPRRRRTHRSISDEAGVDLLRTAFVKLSRSERIHYITNMLITMKAPVEVLIPLAEWESDLVRQEEDGWDIKTSG